MRAEQEQPGSPGASNHCQSAPPTHRRWLRLLGWAAAASLLLLLVILAYAADRMTLQGRVMRHVELLGEKIGGADQHTLVQITAQLGSRLGSTPLCLRLRAETRQVAPAELGFGLDATATGHRVLAAGRTGRLFADFGWWLRGWFRSVRMEPVVVLDRSRVDHLLNELESLLPDRPVAGGLRIVGNTVTAQYPRAGVRVDRALAEQLIMATLLAEPRPCVELPLVLTPPPLDRQSVDRALQRAQHLLQAPLELRSVDPEASLRLEPTELGALLRTRVRIGPRPALELEIDRARLEVRLGPLRQQLEHPPRNARFLVTATDEVTIEPSEPGLRIDAQAVSDALWVAAASPTRTAELPFDRSQLPQLSTEAARALRITRLVSSFTTRHPCCQPRVENIHRIADLLDGTVLWPGETFSVNQAVGPRTRANGFVPAPTIEEGEMVDTPGGGISQFATTLFNALFYGGYEIIERQPHSYYFARYPMGHEATLSYPKPDLVFRNDSEAGLLIKCEYGQTFIRVKLFGDNGGRRVVARVSPMIEITQPPVRFVPNRRLDPSRDQVRNPGTIGWSVIVSRLLTYPDGRTKEEKRKVTYSPRPREVEVHPCRIPRGEPGYTGEPCPLPADSALAPGPGAGAPEATTGAAHEPPSAYSPPSGPRP